MVDQYSINSTYFKKIRNFFHQGLFHPWPYRIVRIALAAFFIYAGMTKLFGYRDLGLIGVGATCLSLSRRVWEYHENQHKEVFNERNQKHL